MARVPLFCPIDGTSIGAANTNITPTLGPGNGTGAVGDHYHLQFAIDLTCQNGHRWRSEEQGITLTRTV